MSTPDIEQRVAFGPFQMRHLQEQVNDAMRRSFYSYLAEKVIPLLQGRIVRIDGRLWSHYDRPEFAGIPEVRHRYYYEVSLMSEAGSEDAWGEVDYNPQSSTFAAARIKPAGVRTLSEKRQNEQQRQAEWEFQQRNSDHGGDCCPQCNSKHVARLVYGLVLLPTPELRAELDAGRARLGGCCISDISPKWCCVACGRRWGLSSRPDGSAPSHICC
jgi:hypothetical protein